MQEKISCKTSLENVRLSTRKRSAGLVHSCKQSGRFFQLKKPCSIEFGTVKLPKLQLSCNLQLDQDQPHEPLNTQIERRLYGVELAEWLLGFAYENNLTAETLHLCRSLLERYINVRESKFFDSLELSAATCLWIATKFHAATSTLDAFQVASYVGKSFSAQDIIAKEVDILQTLKFRILNTTVIDILHMRLWDIKEMQQHKIRAAEYLVDLSFLSRDFREYSKYSIAEAAVRLAQIDTIDIPAFMNAIAAFDPRLRKPAMCLYVAHHRNLHYLYHTTRRQTLKRKYLYDLQDPWSLKKV